MRSPSHPRGPRGGAGPARRKRNLPAWVRDKEPGWTALLRFRRLDGAARVLGRRSLGFHAVRLLDSGDGGALCPALADFLAQVVGLDELVAVQDADEHGEKPQGADAVARIDADRRQRAQIGGRKRRRSFERLADPPPVLVPR